MSGAADWLLIVEAAGRVLRFATSARVVDGAIYRPGLVGDIEIESGPDSVPLAVIGNDIRGVAAELDAGTATLSLLDEDDDVTVYASGPIVEVAYAALGEPVEFTISRSVPGLSLGGQVPAPTARVDATTWPITALHTLAHSGLSYPVIFGYPGDSGGATPACVVPCPMAQWKSATTTTTYVVLSEDPAAAITQVRVRNQSTLAEANQVTVRVADLLGQRVLCSDFTSGGVGTVPTDPSHVLLVGFTSATGGGVARALYDVVRYLLQRWAPESVDWARLPQIAAFLDGFNVDSWITAPVADPWALIEDLLRDLEVEVRVGDRGRYLVARRYQLDPARTWGSLNVDADCIREGAYRVDGPPENEISLQYRPSPETGYLATIIGTGNRLDVQPAGTDPGALVVETAMSRRSYAKYGRKPGAPLTLDWAWESGTALAAIHRILDRTALPATLVSYRVRPQAVRGLIEGDEVLITDPDRPWVDQPGIVDSPPVRGLESVTVNLRVPQAAS